MVIPNVRPFDYTIHDIKHWNISFARFNSNYPLEWQPLQAEKHQVWFFLVEK
ncbi:hypothetical protein NB231_12821 [Nitrococcus mobilis Nb-231]|uniref:Uncharacterized protein n=1 Tax=Nitrococcus mobilis Nb-231 TaxID=314278 RepID=A4BU99_9GAMM|nr:hypothetical protein NB231_12821 [Nitrococcus mobilis Nb-231]